MRRCTRLRKKEPESGLRGERLAYHSSLSGLAIWNLKYLWKMERQNSVQPFVGNHHIPVLDVKSDAPRHPKHALWSADRPFRRNVAIVVDAPDTHVSLVRREFRVWARAPDTDQDFSLGRIHGDRTTKGVQMTCRSAEHGFGLYVPRIRAVEDGETTLAPAD